MIIIQYICRVLTFLAFWGFGLATVLPYLIICAFVSTTIQNKMDDVCSFILGSIINWGRAETVNVYGQDLVEQYFDSNSILPE